MKPIVQISLDITDLDEALKTAELAMRAGVDWLEAGTPLREQSREDIPGFELVTDLDRAGNDSRIRGAVVNTT